jgi:hypothetical protein
MQNNKIIEYKVICHNVKFQENFNKFVNEQIQKGWQPFGCICISSFRGDYFYEQPMVKYAE